MNIDINKPLKAKVFDANESWHDTSRLTIDVQTIILPHPPYVTQPTILYNGGRSECFELLPQEEQ